MISLLELLQILSHARVWFPAHSTDLIRLRNVGLVSEEVVIEDLLQWSLPKHVRLIQLSDMIINVVIIESYRVTKTSSLF